MNKNITIIAIARAKIEAITKFRPYLVKFISRISHKNIPAKITI